MSSIAGKVDNPYAPPGEWSSRWGKGFLALCGTFVFWGLGHFLVGRPRRALKWLAAWAIVLAASVSALLAPTWVPALIVLVPLQLLLTLAALVDAFLSGRRSNNVRPRRAWQRYAAGIILLVLAGATSTGFASALRLWAGAYAVQSSGAMKPAIEPGDRILVRNGIEPRRWDVVLYHPPVRPDQLFIHRVVGLPGEKVEILDGRVRINDLPIAPPDSGLIYRGVLPDFSSIGRAGCTGHPITLGPDEYFMLGDNTSISYDSRWWSVAATGHQIGAVPRSELMGRATAVYWPPARWRVLR